MAGMRKLSMTMTKSNPDDSSVSSDHASSSDHSGSASNSASSKTDGTGHRSESSSSFDLARDETKAVNRSKMLMLFCLFAVCAVLGAMVWFILNNEETVRFQHEARNLALEVSELIHFEAMEVFGAVDAMANDITSLVRSTTDQWPNITIPDFEIYGDKYLQLSAALQFSFAPLVSNVSQWNAYAQSNTGWLNKSLAMQADLKAEDFMSTAYNRHLVEETTSNIPETMWRYWNGVNGTKVEQTGPGVTVGPAGFAPLWMQSPAPKDASIINLDLLSDPIFRSVYKGLLKTQTGVLSRVMDLEFLYGGAVHDDSVHPHSFLMNPIFDWFSDLSDEHDGHAEADGHQDLAGLLIAVISWDTYFTNLLVEGTNGVIVVLHSNCGDFYTYQLDGGTAVYLGPGDLHDPAYNGLEYDTPFYALKSTNDPHLDVGAVDGHEDDDESLNNCVYDMRIFPSATLEASYRTNKPVLFSVVVVIVFIFTMMVFIMYDCLVQYRQNKMMATAKRTNAIVSSLFPKNVRDRLMKEAEEQAKLELEEQKKGSMFKAGAKSKLKDFLDEDLGEAAKEGTLTDSKPIADLFPEVTIMFGDIVGFTAWSSVREPAQVFTLLETLFAAFDAIAVRRRIFKVETVGDCYVAVAGLPDPRKDHAVAMARFARDVLQTMNDLTKKMEVTLGPDTGDLSLRIGLHSGQVTAGVLRGEKSRFQLFGDAMNTTARIESNGQRNRIHISQETADLLCASGKSHWVQAREDKIVAKGKGELQTFWLTVKKQSGGSTTERSDDNSEVDEDAETEQVVHAPTPTVPVTPMADKLGRLVDWNTDVMARLLKQVIARRQASESQGRGLDKSLQLEASQQLNGTVLDEMVDIIRLPEFDAKAASKQKDPDSINLGEEVVSQLHDYVTVVSTLYRDNPFHNFEHASHVTMSVVKLLGRIVAPDALDELHMQKDGSKAGLIESTLHDHTYGITSDPLTQLACVFAALIHDVDHTGVPNAQLVKEQVHIAEVYKNKSVAEQNSVDVAWELLMDPGYQELCDAIFPSKLEKMRFRQLVVNSVMATDIVDKELKNRRNARWEKAFQEGTLTESAKDTTDRKATIVIEHLIQASDVAHTMQHWHIYRKWNERLFHEMYKAYKTGRADTDPAEFWYQGEIGFFDFYIIPLAKKLKDCGVFGVSSDEYLNYATKNRKEWESRGFDVVANMVEKYRAQYADDSEVGLDTIQDDEKVPLRSALLSTASDDGTRGLELAQVEDAVRTEESNDKNESAAPDVREYLKNNLEGSSVQATATKVSEQDMSFL